MNVFQYAASEEAMIERIWNELGYERKTTFFSDLSIAEFVSGEEGVKDTFDRVMNEWKDNVIYFTEFVLSLNHKTWEHYERGNESLSKLYSDLYYKANDFAYEHFKGDDLTYYFNTTD